MNAKEAVSARIDRVVTSGTFSLDGGSWEVDNNVWIVGDDEECVVIDAAHDASAIAAAVAGRRVVAILCTHGHDDHIDAAHDLAMLTGAGVWLHPDDRMLWDRVYPEWEPAGPLMDLQEFDVAKVTLKVMHTPGHAPGACCFYAPELGALFSGDTLFAGGPGATGRSFSDFPTIIESIEGRLLSLPPQTVVHTGHGDNTTIGAESPDVAAWVSRGH